MIDLEYLSVYLEMTEKTSPPLYSYYYHYQLSSSYFSIAAYIETRSVREKERDLIV